MSKNRLLLIIVCLFLVHAQLGIASSLGTLPLIPSLKVSPIESNQEIIFVKILYEGEFKEGIRFQILPGINTILEDEKTEPHEVGYTQAPLGSS